MRVVKNAQVQLGEYDIASIEINLKSRDDIPKTLIGLKHLYTTPSIREKVFAILTQAFPQGVNPNNGRPAIELWKVFVLGVLRLSLNCDYDRLCELANNHRTLRQMLGHGLSDYDDQYTVQTLKNNVPLLSEELLEQINQIVVEEGHRLIQYAGHQALKKKKKLREATTPL